MGANSSTVTFNIQPILENDRVIVSPLAVNDFEDLYAAASDPKIWEQHPNKDRWKREVFQVFFDGAIESKGAFKIIDKATGGIIGSTRFYDYNQAENSILIGYTFYKTAYWGKGVNQAVKKMMLDYVFRFVDRVYLHVGANNIRSQIAVGRLGAKKVGEQEVAYFGEAPKLNFIYAIDNGIRLEPFGSDDFRRLISWVDSEELMVQFAGSIFTYPLTEEQLDTYLTDEKRHAFKVVYPGTNQVIGHAELYITDPSMALISRVLVGDKAYRGKGIGGQIIRRLTELAFGQFKVGAVELNVYDWNTAAIKCYEREGFTLNPDKVKTTEVKGQTWKAINMVVSPKLP